MKLRIPSSALWPWNRGPSKMDRILTNQAAMMAALVNIERLAQMADTNLDALVPAVAALTSAVTSETDAVTTAVAALQAIPAVSADPRAADLLAAINTATTNISNASTQLASAVPATPAAPTPSTGT